MTSTNLDGNLGPAPWTPGNGLIAEDVIDYALPILDQRARGVSFEDIAASLGMPVQRLVATLLRLADAIRWDAAAAGFTTDLDALDSRGWAVDEGQADA